VPLLASLIHSFLGWEEGEGRGVTWPKRGTGSHLLHAQARCWACRTEAILGQWLGISKGSGH
jgi:hypothetical protein